MKYHTSELVKELATVKSRKQDIVIPRGRSIIVSCRATVGPVTKIVTFTIKKEKMYYEKVTSHILFVIFGWNIFFDSSMLIHTIPINRCTSNRP